MFIIETVENYAFSLRLGILVELIGILLYVIYSNLSIIRSPKLLSVNIILKPLVKLVTSKFPTSQELAPKWNGYISSNYYYMTKVSPNSIIK